MHFQFRTGRSAVLALRVFVMLMAATFAANAADHPPVSLPPAHATITAAQLTKLNQALASHHADNDPAVRSIQRRNMGPGANCDYSRND